SGLIRGVGPRLAHAIVSHFGEETLKIIDTEPARLREVVNIGAIRQAQIVEAWAEQKAVAALMVALQGFGVSPLLAAKIYRVYGDQALHVLTTDPYQLVGRVRGIAFQSADRIALRSGVPEDSPQRIKAAVVDRIEAAAAGGGHCFVPRRALVAQVAALVEQDEEKIHQAIDALNAERRVVVEADPAQPDRPLVYGKQEHGREVALAGHLTRLLRAPSALRLRPYQEDES